MRRLGALCLVLAAGCGDPLATGEYAPAYLTLQGQILKSGPTPTPSIVLLWQNDFGDGVSYSGQLGRVDKQLGSFTIDLDALPPAKAIHSIPDATAVTIPGLDPNLRFAVATVIAFADGNGNGRFDLVATPDEPSPDRVLGAASDIDIFFLAQGRPADPDTLVGLFPTAIGFSLVQREQTRPPSFFDCGYFTDEGQRYSKPCDRPVVAPAQLLPVDTPITIDLDPSPELAERLQGYSCSSFWGERDYSDFDEVDGVNVTSCNRGCTICSGADCPLDLPPPGTPFQCNAAATAYVYTVCKPDQSRCGTSFCHYGHGERQPSQPLPAGWPCPLGVPL